MIKPLTAWELRSKLDADPQVIAERKAYADILRSMPRRKAKGGGISARAFMATLSTAGRSS